MVSHILASPQVSALLTTLALSAIWFVVGRIGRFVEAQGARRGLDALIVIGKQLESLGYDGDKLKGKPGAPEGVTAKIDAAVARAVAEALARTVQ